MLTRAIINHVIQQNVEVQHTLATYAGRSVRLLLPLVQIDGVIGAAGLLMATPAPPETELRFHESALRKIVQGQTPGVGDVTVSGDHALGMALLPLLGALRYDLSDDVARLWGDAAAGWVSRNVAACQASGADLGRNVRAQIADYAQETDAWVVGQAQFDVLAQEVSTLRDDVARLAQRVRRLSPPQD